MNGSMNGSTGEVTRLLEAARHGEDDALDRIVPLVYDELRRMAARQLRRERAGHTLHATALVHEAYLKLAGSGTVEAVDRGHFMAIAARAMRQVLVDHARRRNAEKRGGDWEQTTLSDGDKPLEFQPEELLALDRALDESYESLSRTPRLLSLPGSHEKDVTHIAQLQVDSALLFERVTNTLKLLGDQYLARVYRLVSQRFHLEGWDASILRKLQTLESIYSKMSDRAGTRRMEVLEWIIIILIALSIILSLLPLGAGH